MNRILLLCLTALAAILHLQPALAAESVPAACICTRCPTMPSASATGTSLCSSIARWRWWAFT